MGAFLIVIIIIFPLLLLVGLVSFIVIGIRELIKGFSINPEGRRTPSRIARGFTFIAISLAIVGAFLIVLSYHASTPIAFM